MAIVKQGSTTLNAGAKGEKGDTGSGTLSNSYIPLNISDFENLANAGKTAIIDSVIDLDAASLTLQKDITLDFKGGKLTNGTIVFNGNKIIADPFVELFTTDVTFTGTPYAQDYNIEWFGAVADNSTYINDDVPDATDNKWKHADRFLQIAKGATLVFADTREYYLVNGQDPIDNDVNDNRNRCLILNASDVNIRLNKGVTVKQDTNNHTFVNTFALTRISNVKFYGGGRILGDKDTHTGQLENSICVAFIGACENIVVDDITMENSSGDGVAFGPDSNYTSGQFTGYALGDIDRVTGAFKASSNTIVTDANIKIDNALHAELGYTRVEAGSYKTYDGTTGKFDAFFYDVSDALISYEENFWMYEKLSIPTGTTYMRVVFHQNKITYTDNNGVEQPLRFELRPEGVAENITFSNCRFLRPSRNGISGTSAQRVLITNCVFEGAIGNGLLNSGVDLEDGYRLNRYWVIENNTFQNNGLYDIPIQRPHSVIIRNNVFLRNTDGRNTVIRLTSDADDLQVINNHFYSGTVLAGNENYFDGNIYNDMQIVGTGHTSINETYIDSHILIKAFDDVTILNCKILNTEDKLTKTSQKQNYSLSCSTQSVLGTPVHPKIVLRNITINGEDNLKCLELTSSNTIIDGLEITNSTQRAIIYADKISGFKSEHSLLEYYPTSDISIVENSEFERLYVYQPVSKLIVKNNIFKSVNYTSNFYPLSLKLQAFTDVYFMNNEIFGDANDAGTNIIGDATIANLYATNNIINMPTTMSLLNGSCTFSGYEIYKDNVMDGITLNNVNVGAIEVGNIIDGVLTP